MNIKRKIEIEKVKHKGRDLDSYVPYIDIGFGWEKFMKGYILKDSYDALDVCGSCAGHGCKKCDNKGLKTGVSHDLKYLVEDILDRKVQEYEKGFKVVNQELWT